MEENSTNSFVWESIQHLRHNAQMKTGLTLLPINENSDTFAILVLNCLNDLVAQTQDGQMYM